MPDRKHLFSLILCLSLFLTACSSKPEEAVDGQIWQEDWTQIGTIMGIDAPKQLTLLENKEALAADGLYYATWVAGDFVPYKNSDGDTIDLYDAQLYLLASEAGDGESAQKNFQTWLASAEDNYQIQSKDTVTCNGQPYTLISYNCVSEDTPYDHGVSALGVCGTSAVCVELTCVEDYSEDLTQLLTEFLDNCHYNISVQTRSGQSGLKAS